MLFTFYDDATLPEMTLCASVRTARELAVSFGRRAFDILFDESLADDVVFVSSDLYAELHEYLSTQGRQGSASA